MPIDTRSLSPYMLSNINKGLPESPPSNKPSSKNDAITETNTHQNTASNTKNTQSINNKAQTNPYTHYIEQDVWGRGRTDQLSTLGPHLNADIELDVNKRGQLNISIDGNRELQVLTQAMLPKKVTSVVTNNNTPFEAQHIIRYLAPDNSVSAKVISHSRDDAISVSNTPRTLKVDSQGIVPSDLIAQITRGVHSTNDGKLYRIDNSKVYFLDRQQQQWVKPFGNVTTEANRLISSPKHKEVFAISDDNITSITTGAIVGSDFPAKQLRHITLNGDLIGLNKNTKELLVGHLHETTHTERLSLPLSPKEELIDATIKGDQVYYISQSKNDLGKVINQLYSAPIIADVSEPDNIRFSLQQPVNKIETSKNADVDKITLKGFHHDAQGELYLSLSDHSGESIAPVTPTIIKHSQAWPLDGVVHIENRAGLPEEVIDERAILSKNEQLIRRKDAIFYIDPNNNITYPTNIKSGVQSLAIDAKGEAAYALVNGKVTLLTKGPTTKQFSVTQDITNPLVPKDTTSVTKVEYPSDNIVAFAAANKRLFVQLREDGLIEVVLDGKVKRLETLATLPNNNTAKQLAFDHKGQLLALTENNKLFKIDAESMMNLVDQSPAKENTINQASAWLEVTLESNKAKPRLDNLTEQKTVSAPFTGKVQAIHSGYHAKIKVQTREGEKTSSMMLSKDGGLEIYRSQVTSDAFSDFSHREDLGHVQHQKKFSNLLNKKQIPPKVKLSKKQAIRTRIGNWAAHATDTLRRTPEVLNQATRVKVKGTETSLKVAKAADTIRYNYLNAINNIQQAPKPQSDFTARIQSLDSHFPGMATTSKELVNSLMSELENTLFQAAMHRGMVSTQTGALQVSNKHVQKEFGGSNDLINNLKKLLSHLGISNQKKINELLQVFEKSDQGLKDARPNITQPHSYKPLQIAKEHIQLIAVKLMELDKAILQAANKDYSKIGLSTTIEDIQNTYKENLIAKTNQLGVTSYRQLISQENTMQSMAVSLDRSSSALSRSLRASCGTANHQDTLDKMREVINTMPEGGYIILDQDAAVVPKVQFFKALPLPSDIPVGPDAFLQTKGRIALGDSILISESAGNLFIVLDNKKKAEISTTAGAGISIGALSPFAQRQRQNQVQTEEQGTPPLRLRPELRFNLWAQGLIKTELTDGSVLNIPPEKRDKFLSLLLGGNANAHVKDILAMSSTYLENKKTDVNVTVGLTGQIALRGTANINLGIDKINMYLRQQGELRANLSLVDIDYGNAQRIGRNDARFRKSDQVLHLIPDFHLQLMLRTLGAPEIYVREQSSGFIYDSFGELNTILHRKKLRPQEQPHAGTFNPKERPIKGVKPLTKGVNQLHNVSNQISNNTHKSAKKVQQTTVNNDHFQSFNNALKGWDNKRASQFDERLRTAKNIQKEDYLEAIQLLSTSLHTQYPNISNRLMSTHRAIQESSDDTYQILARTVVHDAMKIILAHREATSEETDSQHLDNNQLQSLNSLILLHSKKEAFEQKLPLRAKLRHTTRVTNVERLIEPGMINRLANTVGLGSTYDGAPHLARLMQQSGDFKRIVEEDIQQAWRTSPGRIIDYTNAATVRLALHPDIEALVNHLATQKKLSPQILSDLQAGKGSRVEVIAEEYQVIPDAEAGKYNMIPYEIEFTQEKTRSRDFDLPTPFLAVGTRTKITLSNINHTVNVDYQPGKKEPVSFSVTRAATTGHQQKTSNSVQIAADIAKASKLTISAYHST